MEVNIRTPLGEIQGLIGQTSIQTFLGIPYGESTAGARRFLPPVPVKPWIGIRKAVSYGPSCPQGKPTLPSQDAASIKGLNAPVGEDCLVLNIWTPGGEDNKRRPVMVWLHGGGFQVGSGSHPVTDGEKLALRGDVVVVSLNHRLGIYGFLRLDELCGSAYEGSGVAGMLDLILALEWIRDNIEAFGGDPGNITLFGESGGGRKVSVLMGMPKAKGLFHRGIVESGPHPRCIPGNVGTRLAERFFEYLGLNVGDVKSLQAISERELFNHFHKFIDVVDDPLLVKGRSGRWLISPIIDGKYLPAHPFSPASPEGRDVPLMIGTNKDEAALFLSYEKDLADLDDAQLIKRLSGVLGDRAQEVLDIHRKHRPKDSPYDLLSAISSEDRRLLSIETAEEKVKQGVAPVYMYFFTWESNQGLLKAAHTMEIPFVFRTLGVTNITGTREDQHILSDIMSDAWIAFARTGDPNHGAMPRWEPYDLERRATMIFDVPPKLEYDPWREERLAWKDAPPKMPWEGEVFVSAMKEKK
ncbi:MAG: carboxylesterase/lipase family protein [Proteobacteria bacterium]|nr:carboxylesterase/lipase family protein [Pseudomonadota bacterium]MBU4471271.1 carboxylesterase/lipase family protein [Pseudomonadota bacterium]MCG2753891.1 carboxylesterase/lipase family protein [Desulfobacteraceae bacterium]